MVGCEVPLRPSPGSGRAVPGCGDSTVGSSGRTDPTLAVDSAGDPAPPRGTAVVCGSAEVARATGRNRSAGSGSGSLRGRIDEFSPTAG